MQCNLCQFIQVLAGAHAFRDCTQRLRTQLQARAGCKILGGSEVAHSTHLLILHALLFAHSVMLLLIVNRATLALILVSLNLAPYAFSTSTVISRAQRFKEIFDAVRWQSLHEYSNAGMTLHTKSSF
jgi:hypothetical protein